MTDPNYPGLAVPVTRLAARVLTGVGVLGLVYGVGIIFLVAPSNESGEGAIFALAAGVSAVIGVLWVMVVRNRLLSAPADPRRFLSTVVIAAGVAELGLLIGITGYVTVGDLFGPAIGGVFFIVGVLILGSTIGSVEFAAQE